MSPLEAEILVKQKYPNAVLMVVTEGPSKGRYSVVDYRDKDHWQAISDGATGGEAWVDAFELHCRYKPLRAMTK